MRLPARSCGIRTAGENQNKIGDSQSETMVVDNETFKSDRGCGGMSEVPSRRLSTYWSGCSRALGQITTGLVVSFKCCSSTRPSGGTSTECCAGGRDFCIGGESLQHRLHKYDRPRLVPTGSETPNVQTAAVSAASGAPSQPCRPSTQFLPARPILSVYPFPREDQQPRAQTLAAPSHSTSEPTRSPTTVYQTSPTSATISPSWRYTV